LSEEKFEESKRVAQNVACQRYRLTQNIDRKGMYAQI
jgi:hypothetical protein